MVKAYETAEKLLQFVKIIIMELLLSVLSCCLLISVVLNDSLLGNNFKFFQNDYVVKMEWAEVVSFNQQYFKEVKIVVSKINRTTAASNISFTSNWNMGKNVQIVFQLYKFLSNEYREFPMRFQMHLCTILANDFGGIGQALKCGNFSECNMLKNNHLKMCNYIPDSSKCPPHLPSGRYRINAQGVYHEVEVFLILGYAEIYRPFKGQ